MLTEILVVFFAVIGMLALAALVVVIVFLAIFVNGHR